VTASFVLLAISEPLFTEVRAERERAVPLGLPPLPVQLAEPSVAALGEKLFFERRLSINDTMSCGMCHIEAQAFTSNDLATSVGMEGKSLRRNASSTSPARNCYFGMAEKTPSRRWPGYQS